MRAPLFRRDPARPTTSYKKFLEHALELSP